MPGSYLVIELSNLCNLACVHCAVSEDAHPHHTTLGSFDLQLANQLFADLAQASLHFDTLILFWLGDPLLHPQFCSIYQQALRFAARHKIFSKIEVHTNAVRMDINIIDALLNSSSIPQVIHFSLDAATADTYKKIKGKDQFIAAARHCAFFLRTKVGRKALWPRPVFQFILGSNNVHEARNFRDHWLDVCTELNTPAQVVAGHVPQGIEPIIFFRQKDCPTREEQEQENALFREFTQKENIPVPPKPQDRIPTENLNPCSGFWKSPVLDWQGNLTFCTRDNTLKNSIGNIQKTPFSKLWLNHKTQSIRDRVAQGDYNSLPLCQDCFIPRSLNHTEISVEEISALSSYMRAR
jgi:radical SAM protein with 4Fe4S-binding SPASM domain